MKKQVTVTKENREFLEKAFKVSSVMIWKALTFESDTDLARRIRKLAVERGGIEMCFCPVLETMHDSDGPVISRSWMTRARSAASAISSKPPVPMRPNMCSSTTTATSRARRSISISTSATTASMR